MEFQILDKLLQLEQINSLSQHKKQVLFKHSTRCPVSRMVKKRLISEIFQKTDEKLDIYCLDLLKHREISNAIAEQYSVKHESPQILVISRGVCIYHSSHSKVSLNNIPDEVEI